MRDKPKISEEAAMTNIELHYIQKPANSYSCKVNNPADVKRKLMMNTLLQFHAIILNELTISPLEYASGSVSPNRHGVKVGKRFCLKWGNSSTTV